MKPNFMNDETKIELLCDHYKDTFSHIKDALKQRDRFFLFVVFLIVLFLFQMYSPKEFGESVSVLISAKMNISNKIDLAFLSSLIWFLLLAFSIKYYQTVVFIERQYKYIHSLEDYINPFFDGKAFTREGKSYLTNYPKFSHWSNFLYTLFYPILLIIILLIKLISEFKIAGYIDFILIVNTILFLGIFISTFLYLLLLHFKK
jgi:hypothetical protein